ncbi:MFS transporter (macronuclear) [Tetrahymena thermophila SB210]|uniref:MFS transporter n=1 Tax=Tetrahymena thermophila (strain SB210) TaxID=312017 RepID=I7MFB2_TETTS|nr:MFS transporter [Tetrahymena thermophila SB210]EAR99579.1 MFS transporter [Tetrahymena thermophila SB210]|eukprot:XP_001019824.1 MFS transporter [Tetrahymena thermophila SB210]
MNLEEKQKQIHNRQQHQNSEFSELNINQQSSLSTQQLTFDQALEKVGSGNRYQIIVFLYFCLQWFFCSCLLLQVNFVLMEAEYDCKNQIPANECNSNWVCKQDNFMDYVIVNKNTLVFYFDPPLICDQSYLYDILCSLSQIGCLVGFLVFSWFADNKGRKTALFFSWMIGTVGVFLSGFSNSIIPFAIGFFLQGFGTNPAIIIHFSFLNEHSLGKFRELSSIGVQVFWGIGESFLVLAAYLVPYWRYLILFVFGIPVALLNFGIFFVQESPKYLHEKNQQEAIRVLNKIARINKREELSYQSLEYPPDNSQNDQYSLIDLIRYKSQRWQTIFASIEFFVIQVVYYGITFAMSEIGLNIYLNSIIIAVFELVGFFLSNYIILKFQRKRVTLIGLIAVAIMSFCYIFLKIPEDCAGSGFCYQKVLQIIFAGIMRFSICIVQCMNFVWFSELYPTTIRSLALGFISVAGTVGSSSAPFVKSAFVKLGLSPMIPLGISGVIGTLCTLPLSETKGKQLIDQIPELEQKNHEQVQFNESNNLQKNILLE